MLCFPSMLVQAAKDAGMKVPEIDVDNEEYDREQFPHWWVFCVLQLDTAMSAGAHWENAKVVAAIPEDEIRQTTLETIEAKGWRF